MGKYMKKGKVAGDVKIMDVAALGVRTRAKTLALQKLAASSGGSGCYLQLRSRLLLKPAALVEAAKKVEEVYGKVEEVGTSSGAENDMDRSTRESTPINLIKDSETLTTPGSSNRPTSSFPINVRTRSAARRSVPTTHEMDKFFAGAEKLQQEIFREKYNYDPVNDLPLSGRFEWVRLK